MLLGWSFDGMIVSQAMGFKRESKSSASATSPCADLRAAYHNCFNRFVSISIHSLNPF